MTSPQHPARTADAGERAAEAARSCVSCGSKRAHNLHPINGFALARCDSCGLRFVPPDALASVNYDELYQSEGGEGPYDFYVQDAAAIRAGKPTTLPRPRQLALDRIVRDRAASVLEIGSGVGSFLHALQKRGIDCAGVEPSGQALKLARQYLSCDLHHGVFHEHVFPGRQFDAICLWEVLEHISDVQPFLAMVTSKLTQGGAGGAGGAVYLSTPNYGSSWMWNDVPRDPRSRPPVHVTFWNARSLGALLQSMGLVNIDVRHMQYPVNPGARSGKPLGRYRASIDALLRPRQRKTLYARAMRPGSSSRPLLHIDER